MFEGEKAIANSIEAASLAAGKGLSEANAIIDKAKANIDDTIRKIDDEIEKVDCIKTATVESLRNLIIIDFTIVHIDSCYTDKKYIFTSQGYYNDLDRYRIVQCQLERNLQKSVTVKDVVDNLSQLSQLSRRTSCILRQTTGITIAEDDFNRYSAAFAIWYLTTKK